jgi:nicotinate-nucleotide adenylyltransferase
MQLLYPLEFRNSLEVRLDSARLGPEHSDLWCDIHKLENLSDIDQYNLLIALADFFPFMPAHSSNPHGWAPKEMLKGEISGSVTFFGGSFSPFHEGHMACLDLCPEKNIVIVPDCNPDKDLRDLANPLNDFFKICELVKEKSYSVYPGFIGRHRPNPTSGWLPKVNIPEKNFLMGDDSFMNLPHWIEADTVVRALTKLYVVPRTHHVSEYEAQVKKLKKINHELQVILLPDHPHKEVSSTKLRKK